jgi:hypothetical protein
LRASTIYYDIVCNASIPQMRKSQVTFLSGDFVKEAQAGGGLYRVARAKGSIIPST